MKIDDWQASPAARRHMRVKHGVEWGEVDEVFEAGPTIRRGRLVRGQQRYMAEGRTAGGRRLRIIFRASGRTAVVITAWAL